MAFTPDVYVDGTQKASNYETEIVNRMNQPSSLTPSMWGTFNPSTGAGTIYAKFKNTGSSVISGNLYFVIVEDSIYYAGPNGDLWHNHVARDYLPTEIGQAVTIAVGDSVIQNQGFVINPAWNKNKIEIYAWVQQTAAPKENYQACIAKLSALGWSPDLPTITKPLDFGRLPYLQPTLTFFSTDFNGDNIRYRIVWDDDPTFASPDSATTGLYASGAIVNFTLPSALTDNRTYWWRVKCTDPSGTGLWTDYTIKRSFTVGLSLPLNTCSWFQTTGAQFANNSFNTTMVQGDSIILIAGGGSVTDTAFIEVFESGLPSGWTVVDGNADNFKWTVGTTADIGGYTPPGYGTSYAYYSDDDAGSGVINYNEALISPAIRVPPAATSLELAYGYGFQIYETGEKMRVKSRRKTGSTWSAWTDLVVYASSASGTASHSLNSYLPCDSVQFQWFFSDSTSASHWGYACACDNAVLRYTYTTSGNEGSVVSTMMDFHDLSTTFTRNHWGGLVWHKATAGDSIGIQIEYYNGSIWQLIPNTVLPGNSAGFYSTVIADTLSLSGLDTTTYRRIRLIGLFYRKGTKAPNNPALCDWEVGNYTNYIGIADNDPSEGYSNPFLSINPSIVKSRLNIVCSIDNQNGKVRLNIYDATGRLVRQFDHLVTGQQSCRLVWDCRDDTGKELPNGIYFVRLESENNTVVEKAILLR